ncbi:MAG TPA: FMN-binding negative transcriptional regulator [Pirellulaceae bacterium]|nr:FMN-binding negative transcriptional regulator [Pirellulaceae bacterium]
MYIPTHFAEHNLATLHDAIEHYSFATLVSSAAGGMSASHLPLLLDRGSGASGTLVGHMARANLQWRDAAGQEVLAIFSGPHAYISPQWYEAKEVVPTWNYVAVHAYGCFELMNDEAELEALLARMVQTYEASQPRPWTFEEPVEFVQRMLRQIVGFRIPISRLEGKWKLNQNRPEGQREKVVAKLGEKSDENSREVARLMEQRERL